DEEILESIPMNNYYIVTKLFPWFRILLFSGLNSILFKNNIYVGFLFLGYWAPSCLTAFYLTKDIKNYDIAKVDNIFTTSKNKFRKHLTYTLVNEDCYVNFNPEI